MFGFGFGCECSGCFDFVVVIVGSGSVFDLEGHDDVDVDLFELLDCLRQWLWLR